jgi:hypothetical protein
MQRREAKNPPERPLISAETGNLKIGVKNPRRNGLFLIDDSFRSSGRLDGGVGSHMRTRLHGNSLLTGKLTGNFANSGVQARNLDEKSEGNQSLVAKFPKKHNRDFFRTNRELRIDNRDLAIDRRKRPFLAHLFRAAADAICSHR